MIGSKHRFTIASLFLLEVIIVILFSGLGIIVHGSGSQPMGHYPLGIAYHILAFQFIVVAKL